MERWWTLLLLGVIACGSHVGDVDVPVDADAAVHVDATVDAPLNLSNLTFQNTGLGGGGGMVSIALAPAGSPPTMLVGSDWAGLFRSSDNGQTFTPAMTGLLRDAQISVATIKYHPTIPSKVYAGVGVGGLNGGVFVSTDDGLSWMNPVTGPNRPMFSGQGGYDGIAGRPCGNLLAIDAPASGPSYLWAGTFRDGLMRSADDGVTWTVFGSSATSGETLVGKYIRSIALDPENTDNLYVAVYGYGIYKTTAARSADPTVQTFTLLPGSPAYPEELFFLGTGSTRRLYIAVGNGGPLVNATDSGIAYIRTGVSDAIVSITSNLPTGRNWLSVSGWRDGGTGASDLLVISNDNPLKTTLYDAVWISTTGGSSWTKVGNVSFHVGGPSGPLWWESQDPGFGSTCMLGGEQYVAWQIAVRKPFIYLSGKSGVWESPDQGVSWFPAVTGVGASYGFGLAADPKNDNVFVAMGDWTFLSSQDRLVTPRRGLGVPGGNTFGVFVDTQTTPSTVYIATKQSAGNGTVGDVVFSSDPTNPNAVWTSSGLNLVAPSGSAPVGVAVGRSSNHDVAIVAAVARAGVYQKLGTGSWARVLPNQPASNAPLVWKAGSPHVYFYDAMTGVWHSPDAGASGSWTNVWPHPSVAQYSADLAADSTRNLVYISSADPAATGVYRTSYDSPSTPVRLTADGLDVCNHTWTTCKPGPIAVDSVSGRIWLVERTATAHANLNLYYLDYAASAWQKVTDEYVAGLAPEPIDLVVVPRGTGGSLYLEVAKGGAVLRADY